MGYCLGGHGKVSTLDYCQDSETQIGLMESAGSGPAQTAAILVLHAMEEAAHSHWPLTCIQTTSRHGDVILMAKLNSISNSARSWPEHVLAWLRLRIKMAADNVFASVSLV